MHVEYKVESFLDSTFDPESNRVARFRVMGFFLAGNYRVGAMGFQLSFPGRFGPFAGPLGARFMGYRKYVSIPF